MKIKKERINNLRKKERKKEKKKTNLTVNQEIFFRPTFSFMWPETCSIVEIHE